MLDALLRRLTQPAFDAVTRRFALNPVALALAGFAAGLAALSAIVLHYYLPGLALVLASRMLAGLAAAAARRTDEPAAYASVFDAVVFAGVPFAFALGDPSRALAAVFVMFGLAAQMSSALALREMRSLIGNFEILAAFAIACVFPDRFAIVAYVVGVLCFAAAGLRIAAGIAQRRSA